MLMEFDIVVRNQVHNELFFMNLVHRLVGSIIPIKRNGMSTLCFVPIYLMHCLDRVFQFLNRTASNQVISGVFNLYRYFLTFSEGE